MLHDLHADVGDAQELRTHVADGTRTEHEDTARPTLKGDADAVRRRGSAVDERRGLLGRQGPGHRDELLGVHPEELPRSHPRPRGRR